MAGMKIDGKTLETEGVLEAARRICLAARTAPKARGKDDLFTMVVTGEDKDDLAAEMERQGRAKEIAFFVRDAGNIRQAAAVVLLGTRISQLGLPNCGFCGFEDCDDNRRHNGICVYNTGDLGIAVGAAAGAAMDNRVDCRVMFSAGKAALALGLLGPEVKIAYGIPLSVSGKNPFFDRK